MTTSAPVIVSVIGRSEQAVAGELVGHGLAMSPSEARRLGGLLGRDPTRAEAFLFDVAWSEHCSYKSSRPVLSRFFTGKSLPRHVVLGPGEDAGIVRLATHNGRSYCVVMSHESHNHPSQVLPVEGAATGIGGIVRDVYCMGADVVGVLDALRFGDPRTPACADIARGVVDGIWSYGNALGVPNLGGDVYFDEGFDDNCLVNVVALGIVPEDRIVRSRVPQRATQEPYVAILVGKPTDSSGFGGASFASADLEADDSGGNLGAVQVADPFLKRVIAEANRVVLDELFAAGVEVGFKDLGAGGIGGATVELADAGNFGVEIHLDAVRTAERDLPAEVILVGETQERFVWAVPERMAARVIAIYESEFDLPGLHPGAGAVVLGRFTDDGQVTIHHQGAVVARVAARDLTEGIAYERKAAPVPAPPSRPAHPATDVALADVPATLERLVTHPDGASRGYVYRHYDPEVRGQTVLRPGEADACVIAPIPGSLVGMAVAVDGNPHRGRDDAYQAGAYATAGAIRNVVTVGARPIALSDCLNFGNPEVPEVFTAFREAVRGIAETATAIGLADDPGTTVPIITGNVSFYNQSVGGDPIPHSPIVGCVGVIDDVRGARDQSVKRAGDRLVVLGRVESRLGGSLYARVLGLDAEYPSLDVDHERRLMHAVLDAHRTGGVTAAHDVSEGGLLVTLFEMLVPAELETGLGMRVELDALAGGPRLDARLFGEAGAVVLSVGPDDVDAIAACAARHGVDCADLGRVTAQPLLEITSGDDRVRVDVDRIRSLWQGGLGTWLR